MKKILKLSFLLIAVVGAASACNGNMGQRNMSTVSVVGSGTVMVQPDQIQMNISLTHTASTTGAAQQQVNRMVGQALEVLQGFGIEDKSISTVSLTFRPEYQFTGGQRKLIGQNVRQTISFSVADIQNNDEKAAQILDKLVQINGIELDRMDFSVKDNADYFMQARELAFRKAIEKAQQFAELSGLKVGRVLSVSEEGSPQIMPMANRFMATQAMMDMSLGSPTVLPSGEQEITARISVIFKLE